jgi:hypothetical protein
VESLTEVNETTFEEYVGRMMKEGVEQMEKDQPELAAMLAKEM